MLKKKKSKTGHLKTSAIHNKTHKKLHIQQIRTISGVIRYHKTQCKQSRSAGNKDTITKSMSA